MPSLFLGVLNHIDNIHPSVGSFNPIIYMIWFQLEEKLEIKCFGPLNKWQPIKPYEYRILFHNRNKTNILAQNQFCGCQGGRNRYLRPP